MRFYYYILCSLFLKKIQKRLIEVVIDHGKDVRITKTFMAGELYYKIEGTYTRGIRSVITAEEMKEQYEHLSKLNSEIKLRCESFKK